MERLRISSVGVLTVGLALALTGPASARTWAAGYGQFQAIFATMVGRDPNATETQQFQSSFLNDAVSIGQLQVMVATLPQTANAIYLKQMHVAIKDEERPIVTKWIGKNGYAYALNRLGAIYVAYSTLLGRPFEQTASALDYWMGCGLQDSCVADGVRASGEYRGVVERKINEMANETLGHGYTGSDLNYWVTQYLSRGPDGVLAIFKGSEEFRNVVRNWVRNVAQDGLGRQFSAADNEAWTNVFFSAGKDAVLKGILSSREAIERLYNDGVRRPIDAAAFEGYSKLLSASFANETFDYARTDVATSVEATQNRDYYAPAIAAYVKEGDALYYNPRPMFYAGDRVRLLLPKNPKYAVRVKDGQLRADLLPRHRMPENNRASFNWQLVYVRGYQSFFANNGIWRLQAEGTNLFLGLNRQGGLVVAAANDPNVTTELALPGLINSPYYHRMVGIGFARNLWVGYDEAPVPNLRLRDTNANQNLNGFITMEAAPRP